MGQGTFDNTERKPVTAAELRQRAAKYRRWAVKTLTDARQEAQRLKETAKELTARARELEKEEKTIADNERRSSPAAVDPTASQHSGEPAGI